ncbi:MAG: hypothetical protein LIP16_17850 [Clostridium sp.]|nr:hypothetical protein [Clostridium sp.]
MSGELMPQVTIQCGVFKGSDRAVFIDRKEYGGDIVHQLDGAVAKVDK